MCLLHAAYGIPAVSSEEVEEEIVVGPTIEGSSVTQPHLEIDLSAANTSALGEVEEVEDVATGARAWEASTTPGLSLRFCLASLAGLLGFLGLMAYMLVCYALQVLDDIRLAKRSVDLLHVPMRVSLFPKFYFSALPNKIPLVRSIRWGTTSGWVSFE